MKKVLCSILVVMIMVSMTMVSYAGVNTSQEIDVEDIRSEMDNDEMCIRDSFSMSPRRRMRQRQKMTM